ncbi:hypothetical protein CC86DRAFT_365724 [Ophiobolus disseminans]|uniref:Uncharacterized protein n=1 Tax=Ophiobolus disseminans TaxID=1469910 RepID=A0A6A7AN07_9PLEO|nr:hypothetical protein CC86DRAFT_365724 [Ophiobolus disseminans]
MEDENKHFPTQHIVTASHDCLEVFTYTSWFPGLTKIVRPSWVPDWTIPANPWQSLNPDTNSFSSFDGPAAANLATRGRILTTTTLDCSPVRKGKSNSAGNESSDRPNATLSLLRLERPLLGSFGASSWRHHLCSGGVVFLCVFTRQEEEPQAQNERLTLDISGDWLRALLNRFVCQQLSATDCFNGLSYRLRKRLLKCDEKRWML